MANLNETIDETIVATINFNHNIHVGGTLTIAWPQLELVLHKQDQILLQLQTLTGEVTTMSNTVSQELDEIMTDLAEQTTQIASTADELSQLVTQLQSNPNDPALLARLQEVAAEIKGGTSNLKTATDNAAAAAAGGPSPTPTP